MDSVRLMFDSYSSHTGRMLNLGVAGSPIFRGARSVLSLEEGSNKRRPFFTTSEELFEEEYYDEQLPEKKRRLTTEQVDLLEKSFEAENKLEPERKSELAKKLGLQPRQVAVWFQNRRARWKTKQLERDYDRLKSSYDALLADHGVLFRDNDRLRSQVISLTEKLQQEELASEGKLPGSAIEQATIERQLSPPPELMLVPPQHRGGGDRLSTGSGESVVVDCDGTTLQVDSSGDSYFQESLIEGGPGYCIGQVEGGVVSEEDGGSSDDGCSYIPGGIFENDAQASNWWVWS